MIKAKALDAGSVLKGFALALGMAALSSSSVIAEEVVTRSVDGRYVVQLKDVRVGLIEDSPADRETHFYIATPPGSSLFDFYLSDLIADPDRYALMLTSSEWSSVGVSSTRAHPGELAGVPVARGVNHVGILSGANPSCNLLNQDWERRRQAALTMRTDQYGWIRFDISKMGQSSFIKFVDDKHRSESRYSGVACDFAGGCGVSICRDQVTASISFFSSDKIQGHDYAIKDFDEQIASGKRVLEHVLIDRSVDLTRP